MNKPIDHPADTARLRQTVETAPPPPHYAKVKHREIVLKELETMGVFNKPTISSLALSRIVGEIKWSGAIPIDKFVKEIIRLILNS